MPLTEGHTGPLFRWSQQASVLPPLPHRGLCVPLTPLAYRAAGRQQAGWATWELKQIEPEIAATAGGTVVYNFLTPET